MAQNTCKFARYKTKSAGAQEAHEAIRPTNAAEREAGADAQQKKLYKLIWQRAVASQMAPAKTEKTTITIAGSKTKDTLEAKGEIIQFAGFLKVYGDGKNAEEGILPEVAKGDELTLQTAEAAQNYSRPQPRYTEASLVRKLEELGIGRPSTYAPTISTVQDRGYVEKADVVGGERKIVRLALKDGNVTRNEAVEPIPDDKGKLVPTDIGKVVTDFLVEHFPNVIDYDFTKDVEEHFDDIADGKIAWQKMLHNFYDPFHKTVEKSADISRAEAMQSRPLGVDPKSGRPVSARFGRYGAMVQLGNAEDEEKPKFAGIPAGKNMDTITLEEALELFNLPRSLGHTADGEEILANIGRFGPYIKYGARYVSLGKVDPYSVDLKTANELIAADTEKRAKMTVHDFTEQGIKVLNGRFGPYVTDGKKNAKVPKDQDPAKLTVEDCQKLLEAAPARGPRKRRTRK